MTGMPAATMRSIARDHLRATFELDRRGAALFDQAPGVLERGSGLTW